MKKYLIFLFILSSSHIFSQCILQGSSSITLPDGIATNACNSFGSVEVKIIPTTDCIAGETGFHRVYYNQADYEFLSVVSDNNPFTTSNGSQGIFDYVEISAVIPIDPTTQFYDEYTVTLKPLDTWQPSTSGQQIFVTVFETNQAENNIGTYALNSNEVQISKVVEPTNNLLSNNPSIYNPSSSSSAPANLYIESDFVIDINSSFAGLLTQYDNIYLEGGSSIIVEPNIETDFRYVNFVVCDDITWDGFSLGDDSKLTLRDNVINDAENAILASASVELSLSNNDFHNNYYDLYLDGTSSDLLTIDDFFGNRFENTSALKDRPSGLPTPTKSPINIRVGGYLNADLRSVLGSENIFKDALTGIYSTNTNSIIEWNKFETSGIGVELYGRATASNVDNNVFTDKSTGIKAVTHALRSEGNTFNNVDVGYYLLGTGEREVDLNTNSFDVNEKAIFSFFNQGANIENNTIDILTDNSNSIGIDLFYTESASLRDNTLNLEGIHAGMFFNSSPQNLVQENTINLEDPSFGTRAIDLMDAANTVASCNLIRGDYPSGQSFSDGVGIFLQDAPVSILACNDLDEIEDGFKYIGSSFDNELLGNTFGNHGTALELGDQDFDMNTIISDQVHHGNKWGGTTTTGARNNSSLQNIIDESEFFVDSGEDAKFLPSTIIPNADWFSDVDDMNSTFECVGSLYECDGSPGSGFTFNVPSSDYVDFIRLQLDTLSISDNEKWIWKNQILEYIKNYVDSNDYTTEISSLLTALDNSIQDDFADVQVELNDAFELDLQIQSLSSQILDNLDLYISTSNTTYLSNNSTLITQLETATQSAETAKQTHLDAAEVLLAGITIPTGDDVGQDYYDAYSIFIEYVESDYILTSSQETTLQSIASKCPTEFGKAVSLARGMLRTDNKALYDDFTNCPLSDPRQAVLKNLVEVDIELYPNPVDDRINFTQKVSNVFITDYSGKIVMNNPNECNSVDVSSLQSGIYLVTYDVKGVVQSTKFIKI